MRSVELRAWLMLWLLAAVLGAGSSKAGSRPPDPSLEPATLAFAVPREEAHVLMMGYGIESLIGDFGGGLRVTLHPSSREVDVLKRLTTGDADLGLISFPKVERFLGDLGAGERVGFQFLMGGEAVLVSHLVVLEESPIRSLADLRGHKVALDQRGTIRERQSRAVLTAHGLSYLDLTPLFRSRPGEQILTLVREEAEAALLAVPLPSPIISSLARKLAIRLIPLEPSAVERLESEGGYQRANVPRLTYPGQDTDLVSIADRVRYALLARASLDAGTVHRLVGIILEHPQQFQRICPLANGFNRENVILHTALLPLHPGAGRYYREKGILPRP